MTNSRGELIRINDSQRNENARTAWTLSSHLPRTARTLRSYQPRNARTARTLRSHQPRTARTAATLRSHQPRTARRRGHSGLISRGRRGRSGSSAADCADDADAPVSSAAGVRRRRGHSGRISRGIPGPRGRTWRERRRSCRHAIAATAYCAEHESPLPQISGRIQRKRTWPRSCDSVSHGTAASRADRAHHRRLL